MLRRALNAAMGKAQGGQPSGMRSTLPLLVRMGIAPATIVDVGAADGGWSTLAQKNFPDAELVLFEPQPVHATELHRFKMKNPEATIHHSAVGGAQGASLFDASDPWGGVLQTEATSDSITVSVVTLDDALADARSPFLVKLDTHGVEAEILAGAELTQSRTVAWIVEAYNYRIRPECLLFWELCDYMHVHGFRPIDLVDVMRRPLDDTLWQLDLVFIRSDWSGFNDLSYK